MERDGEKRWRGMKRRNGRSEGEGWGGVGEERERDEEKEW